MTFMSREDAIRQIMDQLKMDRPYAEKFLDYHVSKGHIRSAGENQRVTYDWDHS